MAGWSPGGKSFSISDRASSSARLERAYRRLVACYPRSFRRENTEEIIAVLLATAREDQRRPSVAEAADLLRGAAERWPDATVPGYPALTRPGAPLANPPEDWEPAS